MRKPLDTGFVTRNTPSSRPATISTNVGVFAVHDTTLSLSAILRDRLQRTAPNRQAGAKFLRGTGTDVLIRQRTELAVLICISLKLVGILF